MNYDTVQKLHSLNNDKDDNFIWINSYDTIMSRPVYIYNAIQSTDKIIEFDDFSYYWIIN